MPLKRKHRVVWSHAYAVVNDLDELAPTGMSFDCDRSSPRIDRVVDQFLDHRCWALDNLSSSYLIDKLRRQYRNRRLHLTGLPRPSEIWDI